MSLWPAALALGAAGGVVFLPQLLEAARRPADGRARISAPGQFVELSDGTVHYRWHGPGRGPVVVCVHGLSTPSFVWDAVARRLASMGFRVLTYDLWGRGYSDNPERPHDRALFLRQLDELLATQGIERDFTLFGYSMGGSIATAYAAENAPRMRRLVLVASASLGHVETRFAHFCRTRPVIGDWAMTVAGGFLLRRLLRRQIRTHPDLAPVIRRQMAETRRRGFARAVLSSMRHMLAEDLADEHARVAAAGLPVLALWGDRDPVIPLSSVGRLARIDRHARQVTVAGGDHLLPLARAEAVVTAFLEEAGVG